MFFCRVSKIGNDHLNTSHQSEIMVYNELTGNIIVSYNIWHMVMVYTHNTMMVPIPIDEEVVIYNMNLTNQNILGFPGEITCIKWVIPSIHVSIVNP